MNSILNIEQSYNQWNWQRISRHLLYWSAWTVFYMVVNTNFSNSDNYIVWLLVELHAVQTPRDAGSWRYLARFTAPRRRCSVSWNCDGGGIANISS